jgi:leader peptidase (prepilin peptidase)/N-methyltransferase
MPYLAELPTGLWLTGGLLLGLAVGSFLNVVIHRLPRMLEHDWRAQCAELNGEPAPSGQPPYNLLKPPSTCPSCGHRIRAWENIPLISYLLQRGRCTACGTAISLRYPVVELVTGVFSVVAVWQLGPGIQAVAALPLVWGLIALTFIDYDTQLLPDQITLPLLWLGLLFNINGLYVDLQTAVIGAAAGYLSLWLVFQLFRLLTGKEGMGYGDFKLLALLGAWLGWTVLPQVVLVSSLVGAVVGISLVLLRRHDRQQPIPFGPYLAAAGLIALLWGEQLNRLYLDFAGL